MSTIQKRNRLQTAMKLTSTTNEAGFDAQRNRLRFFSPHPIATASTSFMHLTEETIKREMQDLWKTKILFLAKKKEVSCHEWNLSCQYPILSLQHIESHGFLPRPRHIVFI